MLTLRQRGKSQNYYIRGTVTLGDKRIDVAEFSAGTRDRDAAAHLMAEHETNLRLELMFGPAAKAKGAVIADAFTAYLNKPKAPGSSDVLRVGILNEHVGLMSLTDPLAAWTTFRNAYLLNNAPAGQDRYRSVLQAAVNVYHENYGIPSIKLKAIPFQNQRNRFLSREDRDRLIGSYPSHVRPIATMLAFQGPRTQEALQVQWGIGGVDMERETIYFARTKNGNPRSVAMHPRVKDTLLPIWTDRGKPTSGHVFLNRVGEPYTDTRDLPVQGGNPISSAHNSACKKAGIEDFTPHDWRHHWASQSVMAGVDLVTIMTMGGWKTLRMVTRYASVDVAHQRAAVLLLS